MTPEQEQWLIQAVQGNIERINNHDSVMTELRVQNSEIREGQAMLAQYFREALERFDLSNREAQERHQQAMQEINELRQDFLNHMRAYHPPEER